MRDGTNYRDTGAMDRIESLLSDGMNPEDRTEGKNLIRESGTSGTAKPTTVGSIALLRFVPSDRNNRRRKAKGRIMLKVYESKDCPNDDYPYFSGRVLTSVQRGTSVAELRRIIEAEFRITDARVVYLRTGCYVVTSKSSTAQW